MYVVGGCIVVFLDVYSSRVYSSFLWMYIVVGCIVVFVDVYSRRVYSSFCGCI